MQIRSAAIQEDLLNRMIGLFKMLMTYNMISRPNYREIIVTSVRICALLPSHLECAVLAYWYPVLFLPPYKEGRYIRGAFQ